MAFPGSTVQGITPHRRSGSRGLPGRDIGERSRTGRRPSAGATVGHHRNPTAGQLPALRSSRSVAAIMASSFGCSGPFTNPAPASSCASATPKLAAATAVHAAQSPLPAHSCAAPFLAAVRMARTMASAALIRDAGPLVRGPVLGGPGGAVDPPADRGDGGRLPPDEPIPYPLIIVV